MLKSKSETLSEVDGVIDAYDAWRKNDVKNILDRGNGGVFAAELRSLADQAGRFAMRARSAQSRPDIDTVPAAKLEDLTSILEEMEKAVTEGAAAANPDAVFAALPGDKKHDLTARVVIPLETTKAYYARLRGETRKAEKGVVDPDGSGVNGKGPK